VSWTVLYFPSHTINTSALYWGSLILPIAMMEWKIKATRARVAKMSTLHVDIPGFSANPGYDYRSKFNMISKAALENAKCVLKKILLIADDNNTNSCKNSQCRNQDKLLNFIHSRLNIPGKLILIL
jgi:hypothetical protein